MVDYVALLNQTGLRLRFGNFILPGAALFLFERVFSCRSGGAHTVTEQHQAQFQL